MKSHILIALKEDSKRMSKESAMKTYQTAGNVRRVVKVEKMLIIG